MCYCNLYQVTIFLNTVSPLCTGKHFDLTSLKMDLNSLAESCMRWTEDNQVHCGSCDSVFNRLGLFRRHFLGHIDKSLKDRIRQGMDVYIVGLGGKTYSCLLCRATWTKMAQRDIMRHFVIRHVYESAPKMSWRNYFSFLSSVSFSFKTKFRSVYNMWMYSIYI